MKFATALLSAGLMVGTAIADSFPFERLDKNNSVWLPPPPRDTLTNLLSRSLKRQCRSTADPAQMPTLYRDSMMAHASLGTLFKDLPVIMTTSTEIGPNGVLPQEILDMYPDAPLIKREGEVNAWDNSDFRAAIKATNRTQIIIAGIVTDVCTAFLARSLRAEGYSVWANLEASGTTTKEGVGRRDTNTACAVGGWESSSRKNEMVADR
ncbi:hypothetical protein CHGG_03245 [Chaetomium globosum CBS 148.51]|uniref:Isochorismatase-like domain-containing protein n=1 Tax=Chaetomium globosum (strain ATCC 6205 / CBS 148.51 / DSM 1962 / NBRC 6347 / NRRL 1970) TaxID=306901 RepID=Q2H959_CHAGB|nr:uncharacterized protein CHGG_03245 [Chaetomium globosum CBS 148.51]EAQ91310.1 hypothetical protein CHGG_03245 [Chaetomium globosum CBS 148.51]